MCKEKSEYFFKGQLLWISVNWKPAPAVEKYECHQTDV